MLSKEIQTLTVTEPYIKLSCALGEGPHYEEFSGELRFVDIIRKELHTVSLREGPGSHKVVKLEDSVGVTADIDGRDEEFIVAAKYGFAVYNRTTERLTYVKRTYEGDEKMAERMRFNDGAVDSKGRFWAGSMNDFHVKELQPEGCVFRLDPDMTLHRMISNVSIPNGMAWSPDDKTMYFTDSQTRTICAYDFDAVPGTISNRRVFYALPDNTPGVLDGCTIDVDGYVWAAVHEGSRVVRISPSGEVVTQVVLPAWKPTCPAFAGDVMFVTTAGVGEGEEPPEGSGGHGSVFRVLTGTKGRRKNKFGAF